MDKGTVFRGPKQILSRFWGYQSSFSAGLGGTKAVAQQWGLPKQILSREGGGGGGGMDSEIGQGRNEDV